jgi:uncharacterized membrane protein HdeD (DUF308 family)
MAAKKPAAKKRAAKKPAAKKRAAKKPAAKRGAAKKQAAKRSAAARPRATAVASRGDEGFAKFWWLWLVMGVLWIAVSVVILQFDQASITTVGIIVGAMFLGIAVQNFVLAGLADKHGWLFGVFGLLFLAASALAFISPENTFAALADMLGFLFLIVGIFWIIEAFAAREVNDLWWLGLVSGILMVILAFYTGGQFFIEKAYLLLIFAGIWALMTGVTDIVRAFQIRRVGRLV